MQVLISVCTASEQTEALQKMADGLIERYRQAGKPPPRLIYTDRDCCDGAGNLSKPIKRLFEHAWPDLLVKEDIWHWMRRLGKCATSSQHPLYGRFLGSLTEQIFAWVDGDVRQLEKAKLAELKAANPHMAEVTEKDLVIPLSVKRQFCRRVTRDPEDIRVRVRRTIDAFLGEEAKDFQHNPLFHEEEVLKAWESCQKHLHCICDPDPNEIPLYLPWKTVHVGGVDLQQWKCVRGTVSLESIHMHLIRMIPG